MSSNKLQLDRVERLVISPRRRPRTRRKQAFLDNATSKEDLLLRDLPAGKFDREEWTW